MSDTPPQSSDDEYLAPNDGDMQYSTRFTTWSQKDDSGSGEGSVKTCMPDKDSKYVDDTSDAGESELASVTDLDPDLQEIKGRPDRTNTPYIL
jgi:hypothetical protein